MRKMRKIQNIYKITGQAYKFDNKIFGIRLASTLYGPILFVGLVSIRLRTAFGLPAPNSISEPVSTLFATAGVEI
jgi:hypothetical protein